MNPFEFPEQYREAIAVFECYRRLGFKVDNIKFLLVENPMGGTSVGIQLDAQDRVFTLHVGDLPSNREEAVASWEKLAKAIGEGQVSSEDLVKIWDKSKVRAGFSQFVQNLYRIGFKPPCVLN